MNDDLQDTPYGGLICLRCLKPCTDDNTFPCWCELIDGGSPR